MDRAERETDVRASTVRDSSTPTSSGQNCNKERNVSNTTQNLPAP